MIHHQLPFFERDRLPREFRAFPTPWSHIVRGLGMGFPPRGYRQMDDHYIRTTFHALSRTEYGNNRYTDFGRALAELVLGFSRTAAYPVTPALGRIVGMISDIPSPYSRITAVGVLLGALNKLRLSESLSTTSFETLGEIVVAALRKLTAGHIDGRSSDAHGDYSFVLGSAAAILGFGLCDQLKLLERLNPQIISEALRRSTNIPSQFYRGRAAASLVGALAMSTHSAARMDEIKAIVSSTFASLDESEERFRPWFPAPMSDAYVDVYPRITLLNAAILARVDSGKKVTEHRLAHAFNLAEGLSTAERSHMGLYFMTAMQNLDLVSGKFTSMSRLAEQLLPAWSEIDPGADYFLSGLSYAYLVHAHQLAGSVDSITPEIISSMTHALPRIARTLEGHRNRLYPLSYTLDALASIGKANELFLPAEPGTQRSVIDIMLSHQDSAATDPERTYMLTHALLSWALMQREPG